LHDDHVMGSTGGCGTELDAGSVVVASAAVVVAADAVVSAVLAAVVSGVETEVVSVDPQAAKKTQATTVVTETRTSDRMGDGRRMSS
jgi:uridine phosphorylase